MAYYLGAVANEVAKELDPLMQTIFFKHPGETTAALEAVYNIIIYRACRAKGVTPRELATVLPEGKTKLYGRRKAGEAMETLFADLMEIKDDVKRTRVLVEDIHWAQQQRRVEPVPESQYTNYDAE